MQMARREDWIENVELRSRRCSEGIEIAERPPIGLEQGPGGVLGVLAVDDPAPVAAVEVFRFKSVRRVPQLHTFTSLRSLAVIDFANARTVPKLAAFFSQHGFLYPDATEAEVEAMQTEVATFRELVRLAGGSDRRSAADLLNVLMSKREAKAVGLMPYVPAIAAPEQWQPMGLEPSLRFKSERDENPVLTLSPRNLRDFLLLEVAMIVASGARSRECERCSKLFLVGAKTSYRIDTRFCGTKCKTYSGRDAEKSSFASEAI
jgi:hypothetical protein